MSNEPIISFITCVSNWDKYNREVGASISALDLPPDRYEEIPIDNTNNLFSAAQALNRGIQRSRGTFLVLCHQDIVFPHDWVTRLLERIKEVEGRDPNWGVIGLAGCLRNGSRSGHILDPHGKFYYPPLPRQVQTLDELCLIVKRERAACASTSTLIIFISMALTSALPQSHEACPALPSIAFLSTIQEVTKEMPGMPKRKN